jgi:hypothetical protein
VVDITAPPIANLRPRTVLQALQKRGVEASVESRLSSLSIWALTNRRLRSRVDFCADEVKFGADGWIHR